jgi:hypothetical protein
MVIAMAPASSRSTRSYTVFTQMQMPTDLTGINNYIKVEVESPATHASCHPLASLHEYWPTSLNNKLNGTFTEHAGNHTIKE